MTIGTWNLAWGPEPQWQGPAVRRESPPKNRALLLRCPAGCTKEDVALFGRPQAYFCAVCGGEMEVNRVTRTRRSPPTVVQPGDRYGRLVVEQVIPGGGGRVIRARCRCDCGAVKTVACQHLRDRSTRSCGCLKRDSDAAHPWRRSYQWGRDASP